MLGLIAWVTVDLCLCLICGVVLVTGFVVAGDYVVG